MPDSVPFKLAEHGVRLLTRDQGAKVRACLREAVTALGAGQRVVVEFDGVEAITPSFADECLGRFLLEVGLARFKATVHLHTQDEVMRRLVNRVLAHRAKEASAAA